MDIPISVWHHIIPKTHNEADRTEIKCNAPMNHLTLELKANHQFIIHSCAALKLRLKTYIGIDKIGPETRVTILAADYVRLETISTNTGLKVYSDAANTFVGVVQATADSESLKFSLSAPNTVDITNQTFTGIAMSFFGPQLITMTNT